MASRRTARTIATALWITGGWVAAALLVHWIVRRVPTHAARELGAAATGAAIGLGSAWFELRMIPRVVRALTVGGLLLVRTFFYVGLCALAIHAVTMPVLGLSEHGGLFGYYTSPEYRSFVFGGRFVLALVILTLTSFVINFVRQLNRMLGPGPLTSLLLGRYHRPVAEERIFMFLDLNNSTSIAATLGPLRFNAFKAGLHGGPVVTAEIGDIKKDIVHSGDTVNTAARIEAQCRPLERRVLVSEALLKQCQVPAELELEDIGRAGAAGEGRGAAALQRAGPRLDERAHD